jgi:aspartyl/asparaginyl beta-hydroxylase (cupin superfamily)
MAADARDLAYLKDAADRALGRGDPRTAKDHFERALALATDRIDLWMGLAASLRALGEPEPSLAAVEKALALDPRLFPALLMKGALLEALARPVEAAIVYGHAIKLSPPPDKLQEPTRRSLARAEAVHDAHVADLAERLRAEAGFEGDQRDSALARRADIFIESMIGRRKIFHQEPVNFHYPGLPAIEFYERNEFPFLEELEGCTAQIRAELISVWSELAAELTPYVAYPPGVPLNQWRELNKSLDWSAFHFWLYGERVEAHCEACPATAGALDLIDMPRVPARSPAAMYSILRPQTRIPPHTGVANTRLVLHLPLVVPESCGFRVGGETRQWREGEAWVFDDTIEHEAWNESDEPRAILIADVWSPRLSAEERDLVEKLCAALDRFEGGVKGGDGL